MTRLAIVYHRPFSRAADGGLYEAEGAFSKYVESLAPHFEEIVLCVPLRQGGAEGYRLSAPNVRLCPLPFFDALDGFYRALPRAIVRAWRDSADWDLVNVRAPTWFAPYALLIARLRRIPLFLLVVGDLREAARAVRPTSLKRRLHRAHVELEERLLDGMVSRTLTLCNGASLHARFARPERDVVEMRTSTLSDEAFHVRSDTCQSGTIELLCVSRVDPRKGLRYLPAAIQALARRGHDVRLRIVGPIVGSPGQDEREQTMRRAAELGVAERITFRGAATIDQVFAAYRQADLFVLPSLPGEGVPRVLLEAMAASLPLVSTRVAGIPSAVRDGSTGLLVEPADSDALGEALARLIEDGDLRRQLIARGQSEARQHALGRQADQILTAVRRAYPNVMHSASTETETHRSERGFAPRSLRISIPLAGFNVSGGVQSLIHLANGLAERGHRPRFVVPDFASTPPRPLDSRVQVHVLPTGPFPRRLRQLAYYLRLCWESTQGADVCLANYWPTAYTALLSRLMRGDRTALAYNVRAYEPTTHGDLAESGAAGRRLRSTFAKLSYRLPIPKLVTSEYLRGLVGDRSTAVMGHGIDLAIFHPKEKQTESETVTVGVVGRHGAVKGYQDFLDAQERLAGDLPIRFAVAGERDLPLPSRFASERFTSGSESEMAVFYRACDVFVFPSRSEGFGLPALEALASGCALVSTDCGGVREFAQPEVNCLLVPPAEPAGLAAAIQRLVNDPLARSSLARQGVLDAQAFSRHRVTERFERELLRLATR